MNLCVISCCYEKPQLADILRESCERARLPLHFCAAKELNGVWDDAGNMRVGKLVAAYESLDELKAEGFDHVLWADGFDTFITATERWIEVAWKSYGCPPMILSGEKNCWPADHFANDYPVSDSPYRFINAGTWMAQIDYLRDVLEYMILDQEPNDQLTWTRRFLAKQLPGAIIDTDRRIFHTMWGTEWAEVKHSACVFHYNGGIWRNPEDKRMIEHWEKVKAGEV